MGQIASVHCDACGYEVEIVFGGTMESFEEYFFCPVTCLDCKAITSANTCRKPLACGACASTNVIELHDPRTCTGARTDAERTAWDRTLMNGRYKCPKCERFELRVGETTVFFD